MSILRTKLERYPIRGTAQRFSSDESLVVLSEDATDLPILVDRMKRGNTTFTRVAEYSSMICNDTSTLLNNPPKKIFDPTDVSKQYLQQVNVTQQDAEEQVSNPQNA